MTEPTVTRSVDVTASADAVYALITDLDTLAELADETTAMQWRSGTSAAPGNVFVGTNRNGRRSWKTRCTVTEAVAGQAFEFEVRVSLPPSPVARWRYDITATDSGCRVVESTWDLRPGWFRTPAALVTGVKDRDAASAGTSRPPSPGCRPAPRPEPLTPPDAACSGRWTPYCTGSRPCRVRAATS